jgi:hypothetical protein
LQHAVFNKKRFFCPGQEPFFRRAARHRIAGRRQIATYPSLPVLPLLQAELPLLAGILGTGGKPMAGVVCAAAVCLWARKTSSTSILIQ